MMIMVVREGRKCMCPNKLYKLSQLIAGWQRQCIFSAILSFCLIPLQNVGQKYIRIFKSLWCILYQSVNLFLNMYLFRINWSQNKQTSKNKQTNTNEQIHTKVWLHVQNIEILILDTIKGNDSHVSNIQFWFFNLIHLFVLNASFESKPHLNWTSGCRDRTNFLKFKTTTKKKKKT